MKQTLWTALTLAGLAGLWAAVSSSASEAPVRVGRSLGPEVPALEARVSTHPADADALTRLANAYLDGGAPGASQAALERAPARVRELPGVADARARTLWQLGFTHAALEAQRRMLDACSERECSPVLVGRAQRRERLLSELARHGVEDPRQDPRRTALAYRISMREAALDLR